MLTLRYIALFLFLFMGLSQSSSASIEKKKTYIVQMAKSEMSEKFTQHSHWYVSSLKSVSESAEMIHKEEGSLFPECNSLSNVIIDPIATNWKGDCEISKKFHSSSCNKKLIGARFFSRRYEATLGPMESKESRSPTDDEEHGTHTSTTAPGMASRARISAYKVCCLGGYYSADILAALDKAVDDGVHIDSVAIGIFTPMEQGILVSWSAGNSGPSSDSLSNVAPPWITTVGAGTLYRDFPAYVSLGNGKNFSGVSIYQGKPLPEKAISSVYAGHISTSTNGNFCMTGSLSSEKVAGKIVLCDRGINDRVQEGLVVKDAGGVGMILANTAANGENLIADAHLLPVSGVTEKTGDIIKSYLFSDPNPTATILFPGTITPRILNPDIIAPGVNILAGWSGVVRPTGLAVDTRRLEFNIMSGTSMWCPHVTGLAALLKAARAWWSIAAIRSAVKTTTHVNYRSGQSVLDTATGKPSTPLDHGSGHGNFSMTESPEKVVGKINRPKVWQRFAKILKNFTTVLQYLATILQHLATVLQYLAIVSQYLPTFLQHHATILQHHATILQHRAKTLQHLATFCDTLQQFCEKYFISN